MHQDPSRVIPHDAWFEVLANASNVGVLMFDNDGTPQFSSGLANSLLRCESDDDLERAIDPLVELVGSTNENCARNVPPADLPAARIEFTVDSSDGTHTIAATAHAIRTDDCLGVLVILWDRDRELLVQHDLQMASQFRNVGQLYQALAHDLRSPVGTIVMAASLVRSIGDAALDPKSEVAKQFGEWIETIEEATSTLEQSLNLILGELTTNTESTATFSLSETVDALHKLIAPQARKANVQLETSQSNSPASLSGSPTQVKLALLNIATNAVQAMGDGGVLKIHTSLTDHSASIIIEDTGPGIPEAHFERIFDRYYTTKSFGTGIGLHISREMIRKHGGSIAVASTPGEGTTFTVTLPVTHS